MQIQHVHNHSIETSNTDSEPHGLRVKCEWCCDQKVGRA
jgi:hypothetical protein